jgi:HEAT repeats
VPVASREAPGASGAFFLGPERAAVCARPLGCSGRRRCDSYPVIAAGESILLGMLSQSRVPGVEGDAAFLERALVDEQVQVCAALGKIGTPTARAALTKASSSPREAVRKAAADALAKVAK